MNIFILSRGPQLYSTQSIFRAGLRRKHFVRIIDHMECNLVIEQNQAQIYYRGERLKEVDAVIPRIGSSVTSYGSDVLRQFEMMGIATTMSSDALLQARSKLRSYQVLSNSALGLPKTVFPNLSQDPSEVIQMAGGVPLVIKLLKGTHGLGVILVDNNNTAEAILESFNKLKERVLVQEFIKEAAGADVRALVVDGEVVATMKRRARPGEFRSNLHRGASAISIKPTKAEIDTALKATELLGLKVAGVDMLQSGRGPLVLEVNPSPGLEGIETITRVNVAKKIIEFVEREVERKKMEVG